MSAEPDPTLGRENPRTRVPLRIEEAVMALAMALLVVITTGNVITRYLTNISFAFTEEYSISLMVIATLFGTSVAIAAGRHIRIGYFAELTRGTDAPRPGNGVDGCDGRHVRGAGGLWCRLGL